MSRIARVQDTDYDTIFIHVVTAICIIHSYNKLHTGDILVLANTVPRGKMAGNGAREIYSRLVFLSQ